MPPPQRVLAVVAPGRHGTDAVAYARTLTDIDLTVVALAPHASGPRCGTSILDYNAAVTEAAREDLGRARALLGDGASYAILTDAAATALAEFAAARQFDLILLAPRRGRHPELRRLQATTTARVRVVEPPQPLRA